MRIFHRYIIFGFVLTLGLLVSLSHWIQGGRRAAARPLTVPLPDRYVDRSISSPEQAKRQQLFWLTDQDDSNIDGLAVRLLENPELFATIFPGYSDARADKPFWARYFRKTFDQRLYSPILAVSDAPVQVATSWSGNLSLFQQFGSDIIVFGSSETHYAISPGNLDQLVSVDAASQSRHRKILFCSQGGMRPEKVILSAAALQRSGHVADLVIWGYSLWNAYSPNPASSSGFKQRAKKILSALPFDGMPEQVASIRELMDWSKIVGVSLGAVETESEDNPDRARTFGRFEMRQKMGGSGFRFTQGADEATLTEMAKNAKLFYAYLDGVNESHCNLAGASAQLDEAIAELLKVGRRLIIFIPPTTPLLTKTAPGCFVRGVQAMLESKSSDRVTIKTFDWDHYGLQYQDFVHPDEPGWSRLDINHANYIGARKITTEVSRWVNSSLGIGAVAPAPRGAREPAAQGAMIRAAVR